MAIRETGEHADRPRAAPSCCCASVLEPTFDDGEDLSPVWSSDGRHVYFVSNRSGKLEVFRLTPGTTGEPELIVSSDRPMTPMSESPDGRRLLLTAESETSGSDLAMLDLG